MVMIFLAAECWSVRLQGVEQTKHSLFSLWKELKNVCVFSHCVVFPPFVSLHCDLNANSAAGSTRPLGPRGAHCTWHCHYSLTKPVSYADDFFINLSVISVWLTTVLIFDDPFFKIHFYVKTCCFQALRSEACGNDGGVQLKHLFAIALSVFSLYIFLKHRSSVTGFF